MLITMEKAEAVVAEAAPAALIQSVSQGALAAAADAAAKSILLQTLETMSSYTKTKTALAVATIAAIPIASQWSAHRDLQAELMEAEEALNAARRGLLAERAKKAAEPVRIYRDATAPSTAFAGSAVHPADPGPMLAGDFARQWELALFEQDPVRRSLRC